MEYKKKTTDLPDVIGRLSHIKLDRVQLVMRGYWVPNISGFRHQFITSIDTVTQYRI
jgi:hypothetical protein